MRDETGSTNADAFAAARAGAPHGTVIVARHQSAGRGRLDRRWEAPPGANLLMSVVWRELDGSPHEVTRRLAVAAAIAASEVAGVEVTLKWPNDLLLGDAKLGGILAEAGPGFVVAGLGLNVGWAPPEAARLGDGIDPLDVLAALLDALASPRSGEWEQYRSRLATIGEKVRVELPTGTVTGTALEVEPDGRLVVLDACAITHRIDTGDVVHLRPA